ncbi:MAG: DnaD domain protein [Ruminococcaceae bacterium]|nr:DnaD domain protein [Oscillospiraceae bacterium]
MGKITKVYIDKGLSAERAQSISEAEENDLRVLAALCLVADGEGIANLADAEAMLELDGSEFSGAVKFWRGAGVLKSAKSAKESEALGSVAAVQTAHKDGAVARAVSIEAYSNDELAAVLESRVSTAFVDEAQKVLGRIFNKNEVSKLVGLVDQLGFEEEAVLAILAYSVRLEKKSVSYAEKIALTFYDEDISTTAAVHAHIDYLERQNSTVGKIQSLFGFGSRRLSANEKKYFISWTEDWGFDIEVIKLAYDITVDAIQEPVPRYTNTILKKWYESGLSTPAEVRAFVEEEAQSRRATAASRTQKPKKGSVERNDEVEDWFEQRLRQSFGEQ